MAISISFKKVACMVVICMALISAMTIPRVAEAGGIACGGPNGVSTRLGPCMPYLRGPSWTRPMPNCCTAVTALKNMARTTGDRRAVCNCMKTAASKMKGLNYGNAGRLPNKCGVSMSYTFNPNTNCNTVQ